MSSIFFKTTSSLWLNFDISPVPVVAHRGKADSLQDQDEGSKETDFVSAIGDDSITRFDERRKKRRNNRNRQNRRQKDRGADKGQEKNEN